MAHMVVVWETQNQAHGGQTEMFQSPKVPLLSVIFKEFCLCSQPRVEDGCWIKTECWQALKACLGFPILLASEEKMKIISLAPSLACSSSISWGWWSAFIPPSWDIWQFVQPQGLLRSKGSYFCLWCSAQSRYPTAKPCWIILRGTLF